MYSIEDFREWNKDFHKRLENGEGYGFGDEDMKTDDVDEVKRAFKEETGYDIELIYSLQGGIDFYETEYGIVAIADINGPWAVDLSEDD